MLLYKFEELYQQLRESALSGACTVLILVAADVDGLCACRSLTHLLRADHVTYSLVPVQGYSHVASLLRALGEGNNDIRTVILVNCGAIVNLGNLLPWDRPDLACYVIDSHRPIHLANVYDRERVFVLHDEEEDMEAANLPSDGEGLSGGEESSDDEEEVEEDWEGGDDGYGGESSGGEDEWDADDDGSRSRSRGEEDEFSELASEDEADLSDAGDRSTSTAGSDSKKKGKVKDKDKKKRRKRAGDGSDASDMEEESDAGDASLADRSAASRRSRRSRASDGDGGDGDDEDGDGGSRASSSRRRERPQDAERARRREERRARRARRERIAQYYLGAYYGAPSALVIHRICQEVNRETRDTLWYAIVGLTDLLVHQRVEHAQYRQLVEGLEVEVRASQPALEPQGFAAEDGTLVPACEAGRIAVDFEYQFMLYRHWSLYEAMLHSPYVASKLLLWWSHGRQRLDELLAKMGFSLTQCKEAFKYMDADLKARLRDELDAHQDDFGLDEVFYLSFHRRMHYGAAVSAADVVYSVAALLEAWQGSPGSTADPAAVLAAARTPEEEAAAAESIFTARFHEAYDALAGQDEQKLTEGIHLAMALQKAIFRVAVSLHDKKAVRNLDHFRWTVVHNNLASAEDYLLTQPMAITRLAQLMIDVSREEKARAQQRLQGSNPNARALWRPKPFLVFAERRNSYLVVGVPCPDQRGEVVKHRFASLFRLAADGCKARYRHDGFDSAVLEIDKDSATRFTESLFLAYDAGRAPRSKKGRRRAQAATN